ncbi:MAG: hypothetical protein ACMUIE_05650 [Thermoplasmatota archaeon]
MVRGKDGYKNYGAGDPIHIVVTQDFVEDANRFFSYCREKGYNPSQIIRQAMADWLEKEEKGEISRTNEPAKSSDTFDDKIMDLVRERRSIKRSVSLKTVKEVLEE